MRKAKSFCSIYPSMAEAKTENPKDLNITYYYINITKGDNYVTTNFRNKALSDTEHNPDGRGHHKECRREHSDYSLHQETPAEAGQSQHADADTLLSGGQQ